MTPRSILTATCIGCLESKYVSHNCDGLKGRCMLSNRASKVAWLPYAVLTAFILLLATSCQALAVPEGIPPMGVPGQAERAETAVTALSAEDLQSILVQAGDFSPDLALGQIHKTEPENYVASGIPVPDAIFSQEFEQAGVPQAYVVISFFRVTHLYDVAV